MRTRVVRGGRAPALDGIRGVAVLAVILFHCSLRLEGPWRVAGSWGWMGVDLFFVLSGFLITGILLDARGAPARSYYGGFYGRRVLRIAPAFVFFMGTLIAAPALTGQTAEAHQLLVAHQAWYCAFLANALVARYGWAAVIPQTAPLWSLAVEEQFYLIWPSVVRHLSPGGMVRLGLTVVVLSALARVILARAGVGTDALYVSMPTCADLLAWGAVLASLMRMPNGLPLIRRALWPMLSAASLVVAVVILRFGSAYYWSEAMVMAGYPAIAIAAACVVAIAIVYEPAVLQLPWLTGLGRVSYGLYLWHMTAISVVAQFLRHVGASLIPIAICVALAPTLLSWYFIEQPALWLKRFVPLRPTAQPTADAVLAEGAAEAVAGIAGNVDAGVYRRPSPHRARR